MDLKNCEDEPIHRPESIQDIGYLIAISPTGKIEVVSSNIANFIFQHSADSLIGQSFYKLLEDPDQAMQICMDITGDIQKKNMRQFLYYTFQKGILKDCFGTNQKALVYNSGNLLVLEFEPIALKDQAAVKNREINFPRISPRSDFKRSCQEIAEWVKELTGYDRVMIYKFDPEANGQVIAEAKIDKLESFLGLTYPATDIPAQARRLYTLNWIRMIADVDGKTPELLPSVKSTKRPYLDMSHSGLRSVSPIHLQYLRNMGVKASLSVSLVVEGHLWGLIACHHYSEPVTISSSHRNKLEQVGQMVSYQLAAKESEAAANRLMERLYMVDSAIPSSDEINNVLEALGENSQKVLALLSAAGFCYYHNNKIEVIGECPSKAVIKKIISKAVKNQPNSNFYEKSSTLLKSDTNDEIAGFMLTPIASESNQLGTIWFRKETTQYKDWAGQPKDLKEASDENRLTPRGSFTLWRQTIKGQCDEWTNIDVRVAEKFGKFVISAVLKELNTAKKDVHRLKQVEKAKDQFLANISHELRTPLNAIMGWAQIALNKAATEADRVNALEVILSSANTQSALVNDLLDYTKIISGKLKLNLTSVHLPSLVDEIAESFAVAAEAKNISIARYNRNHSLVTMGDEKRIKQIIVNLVSNAIKFSPEGGTIALSIKKSEGAIILSVEDEGVGLSEQDCLRVFNRFEQAIEGEKAGGMGLGLSICKHLVEMHGGHISAESQGIGKGSLFTVVFPPVSIALQDQKDDYCEEEEKNLKTEDDLKGLVILIAEDQVDALNFLEKALNMQGAKILRAKDGREAHAILKKVKIDLMISDIGMPNLNGIDLIKLVRNNPSNYSNLPCIALTAYSFPKDRVKALNAGFDAYVSKPVNIEELLAVIKKELNRR